MPRLILVSHTKPTKCTCQARVGCNYQHLNYAGSEEDAAQQADAAAAESKQRLVHELQQHSPETLVFTNDNTQGTTAAGPAPQTSQPSLPPAQTVLAQATKKPALGSMVSKTNAGSAPAVSSSESRGGGEVETASGLGRSVRGSQYGRRSDTKQQGTGAVSAQAGQSAEEEEELPPSMTFKVRGCLCQGNTVLSLLGHSQMHPPALGIQCLLLWGWGKQCKQSRVKPCTTMQLLMCTAPLRTYRHYPDLLIKIVLTCWSELC